MTVNILAVDMMGRALPGVHIGYRGSEHLPLWVLTDNRGAVVTGADGTATFRVPAFDTLYVCGDSNLRPTHEVNVDDRGFLRTVLHSSDGAADRNTYFVRTPRGSKLDVSIKFDPPAQVMGAMQRQDYGRLCAPPFD